MMDSRQKKAYELAKRHIGTREIPGPKDNPKIVGWFEHVGHAWVVDDETAWCAAFVGAMLEEAGLQSTRKLNARSYMDWGASVPLGAIQEGDIVVLWRESRDSWKGHVGFFAGWDENDRAGNGSGVFVLGGNQSNSVNIQEYPRARILGVRRAIVGSQNSPGPVGSNSPAPRGSLIQRLIAALLKLFRRK